MDRALTPEEVKVVNWLLDHALVEASIYRHQPIQALRVLGGCNCGCASLYFEPEGQRCKLKMVADELAIYPDGQRAGLLLWGRDGKIVWLEVYDFEPKSSHRIPDVSHLRTWDELGRINIASFILRPQQIP